VEKQACASVGQNKLISSFQELFKKHKKKIAQILVTSKDFTVKETYVNLRQTLEQLLKLHVVPIVNENDVVATDELEDSRKSFGDNDRLSAIMASKLDADFLILLTDVDGLYPDDPKKGKLKRIDEITDLSDLLKIKKGSASKNGRGGVTTKIEAAKMASLSGVKTVITSGLKKQGLLDLVLNHQIDGTLIWPQKALSKSKKWVGLSSGYAGTIIINSGAEKAIVERGASLLPSGIVSTKGSFQSQDIVSIQNEFGTEIGRGLTGFSSSETKKILGQHSDKISKILGEKRKKTVVHRDHMAIFERFP
jgi:glutamate 5-kinase